MSELKADVERAVEAYDAMTTLLGPIGMGLEDGPILPLVEFARQQLAELAERERQAADDAMSADENWVKKIARTICNHKYVMDGICSWFYIRFDCTPTEEGYPGAMVTIHPPGDQGERGIECFDNATRGQVRRLLEALGVKL